MQYWSHHLSPPTKKKTFALKLFSPTTMLAKQNYYKRYFISQIMSQAFFNNANDLL
jgi:hypothetical protein